MARHEDIYSQQLSSYRIMWIIVNFDIPTDTKAHRKMYTDFRKSLLKDGFTMLQYSMYLRHCGSRENCEVHLKRVERNLPLKGIVTVMYITDKQFGDVRMYQGTSYVPTPTEGQQLELF